MDTASFERAAELFRAVLGGVSPADHERPTPCAPFNVAELIDKAIGHLDFCAQGWRPPGVP